MSALKDELTFFINNISDDRLAALRPLLSMLYAEDVTVERVAFDDLANDEKKEMLAAREERARGEYTALDDVDWNAPDEP